MIDYTYLDLYNRTSKDPVSSIDKQLIITVDDGTVITNSNIHGENFELTEGICSDRNLKFGSCESSQVKFRITNDVETLKNKWITITEVLDGHEDEPFTFGTYMVDSDRMTADRHYRDVVAYDRLHAVTGTDYIEWYNSIEFPASIKEIRDSFFEYIGMEQEETELPFDSLEVEADSSIVSVCTGASILESIGELNGRFGHVRRNGVFAWIQLPDLEPPVVDIREFSGKNLVQYESFYTGRINRLKITAGDIETVAGDAATDRENVYAIESNIFLNGIRNENTLQETAEQILEIYGKYSYRPWNGEFRGNPCYEVGDSIRYYDGDMQIKSYILQRTLTGIQQPADQYSADGQEVYDNRLNSTRKLLQTEIDAVLKKPGIVVNSFTNKHDITVQGLERTAASIDFDAVDDAVIVFISSIPVTMDADGTVEVIYYLDRVRLNDYAFKQYYEKGSHILTLEYDFAVLKGTKAEFSVSLKTEYTQSAIREHGAAVKSLTQFARTGIYTELSVDTSVPALSVSRNTIKAVIFSKDLKETKGSRWDGTIEIEDMLKRVNISGDMQVGNLTAAVTAGVQKPGESMLQDTFSDVEIESGISVFFGGEPSAEIE